MLKVTAKYINLAFANKVLTENSCHCIVNWTGSIFFGRDNFLIKKWLLYLIRVTSVLAVLIMAFGTFTSIFAWEFPNYAFSVEHSQVYFIGTVQCQPSFNDGGLHAMQGYFVYRNGLVGEKWYYTERGSSIADTRILRKQSGPYFDDPFNPIKVTFNYNFNWVPHDPNISPMSVGD